MALQKTLVLDNGLTATDAYHKITLLEVIARGETCTAVARVTSYLNSTKADENGAALLERSFTMTTFNKADSSQSAAAQVYTYLKTLDEFDGATDV